MAELPLRAPSPAPDFCVQRWQPVILFLLLRSTGGFSGHISTLSPWWPCKKKNPHTLVTMWFHKQIHYLEDFLSLLMIQMQSSSSRCHNKQKIYYQAYLLGKWVRYEHTQPCKTFGPLNNQQEAAAVCSGKKQRAEMYCIRNKQKLKEIIRPSN